MKYICPKCGSNMKIEEKYTLICNNCWHSMDISEYNNLHYDDDIPEGCAACGGPYPDCMDSCPIFD